MILKRSTNFHDYLAWIEKGGGYTAETLDHLVHSMRQDADGAKNSGEGRLRPSLIGDQCDRKQILSYRFAGGSSYKGSWEAWSGTWLHLAFQAYLLALYPDRMRIEHRVAPSRGRLGVTGKADWYWYGKPAVGNMSIIEGPHMGDYKTIGKTAWVEKAPREMHVQQILFEMFTLDVKQGYLVYQNRYFGGNMITWDVIAEQSDFDKCEERLERLQSHIDSEVFPDLLEPCKAMSGPYETCNWRDKCFEVALQETGE